MKLLLVCTPEDELRLDRFQRLPSLHGHRIVKTTAHHVNPVTLDVLCNKHEIDAVICSQQVALAAILEDTSDWIRPSGNKKVTLDDFAGSLLNLRSGREVLIINPLQRLITVPHEKFIVDRYVSKLTKRDRWYPQTEFKWQYVTEEKAHEVLERIAQARLLAIDIETPWPQDDLRTIDCISYTGYFPDTHTTESYVIDFDQVWHWEFARKANANGVAKVFQNGLFDNAYFLRWGCPVNNYLWDTFHFFHSWLSELPKRLDFVTAFALRRMRYWKDDGSSGTRQDRHRYNAQDGWATVNSLLSMLSEAPAWAVTNYVNHEFPMVFPSMNAAMEGVKSDEARRLNVQAQKQAQIEASRKRISYLLGVPDFNPGSPKQMGELFKILGCGHLDGTGKIEALKAKAAHPLNAMILDECENYKAAAKLASNYLADSCVWQGRILYSINPGKTDTLRAASESSAFDCGNQIQNIPRGDAIKQFYMADDGWLLAEADKAQSEARCVGYLSGEQKLIDLVESPHDYHSWNAAAFFGIPYEEIFQEACEANGFKQKTLNKAIRDLSKRTNHGANYNMGATVMLDTMGPKLVAQAKVTLKLPARWSLKQVCQFLLDRYANTYPGVKGRYYASIINRVELDGKLTSPFGWVRKCFGNPKDNKQHLNAYVAHEPQNLSVACVNKEWYAIWRRTVYGDFRGCVRIKAQIHDSIFFQYKQNRPELAEQVQQMMNTAVTIKGADGKERVMRIPTDLSAGKKYWSELK